LANFPSTTKHSRALLTQYLTKVFIYLLWHISAPTKRTQTPLTTEGYLINDLRSKICISTVKINTDKVGQIFSRTEN